MNKKSKLCVEREVVRKIEELKRERDEALGKLPGKLRGVEALAEEKCRVFLERAERAEKERDNLKYALRTELECTREEEKRADLAEKQLAEANERHDEIRALCAEAGVHHPRVILTRLAKVVEVLEQWIPPHSAACCMPNPGSGMFPEGALQPNWCRCTSLAKQSRSALAAARAEAPEKGGSE